MALRQSKSQPTASAFSIPVAATQPIDPQNSPACDQLFHDFDYCYQKLLLVKDEIVEELELKMLKELYSQLGNLLVLFSLQFFLILLIMLNRVSLTILSTIWPKLHLRDGILLLLTTFPIAGKCAHVFRLSQALIDPNSPQPLHR
jgi:hypothetical protein